MTQKQTLIKKLDTVFSEYIRLRDTVKGLGVCISCGKPITFHTSDCGHFIDRHHSIYRFDEINCNAQCKYCNQLRDGNIANYRKSLVKKYGEEKIQGMETNKHNEYKFGLCELEELIKEYKQKVNELKQ